MEWVVLGVLLACIVLLPLIIYLTYKYSRKPHSGQRIGSVESGENGGNKISVISTECDIRPEEPPRRKTNEAPPSKLLTAPSIASNTNKGRRLSASFLHEQSIMDPGPMPKDIQVEMEKIEAEKNSKKLYD